MSDNCSENYACFPLQTGCDDDLQASSPWWYRWCFSNFICGYISVVEVRKRHDSQSVSAC